MVPTNPLCPPASPPWATMTSTSRRTATRPGRRPSPAGSSGCRHRGRGRPVRRDRPGGRRSRPAARRGWRRTPPRRTAGTVVDRERAVGPGAQPSPLVLAAPGPAGPRCRGCPGHRRRQTAAASSTESHGPNGAADDRDVDAQQVTQSGTHAGSMRRRAGPAHRANAPSSGGSSSPCATANSAAAARVETPIFG